MIPISDITIQRRISDVAYDVKQQVLDGVHESPFYAIQRDESADVAHCAQLMVYIRFIKERSVNEDFVFVFHSSTKRMPQELQTVLDEAVKIVNLIKSQAL